MKYAPEDLWDSQEVADYLGLSTNRAVSTYHGRYEDFPAPVINKGKGRAMLWYRRDIETWSASRTGAAAPRHRR
jgi:predicted DNA-binding transcriptional regulator AlpA